MGLRRKRVRFLKSSLDGGDRLRFATMNRDYFVEATYFENFFDLTRKRTKHQFRPIGIGSLGQQQDRAQASAANVFQFFHINYNRRF